LLIARSVETDDQAIAKELIRAESLNMRHILHARCLNGGV
jgi:hypothetical protein